MTKTNDTFFAREVTTVWVGVFHPDHRYRGGQLREAARIQKNDLGPWVVTIHGDDSAEEGENHQFWDFTEAKEFAAKKVDELVRFEKALKRKSRKIIREAQKNLARMG